MPIYEYVAERCAREPVCSRRKEYLQRISEPALSECRDCGAPVRRVLSSFAAQSGEVGQSSPDPTPLNITGLPAPRGMGGMSGGESPCGHDH